MKQPIRFTLAFVFIFSLFAGVTASQAAPLSYDSSIQVQNLESIDASITLTFYNRDGSVALTASDVVPGNSQTKYFPLTNIGGDPDNDVPTGFDGSVVIASDRKVASITNVHGSDGTSPVAYGASYTGFSSGAATVSVPLLMKDNYGYDTWFSVQNIGSVETDVTVTYTDGVVLSALDLQPGAAAKFDQMDESHVSQWVGAATVASTATDIAITALEVGPNLFAYNGFASGSENPVMPLVQQNNYGYETSLQIQNTGDTATDVTVQYTPGAGEPGTACTEARHIGAKQSVTYALYAFTNFADPNPSSLISENCAVAQFVGSAKVTVNTPAQDLVIVVNQLSRTANKGAAYDAFSATSGADTVVFPLLMDRNYGYWTSFAVVNVGDVAIPRASLVCTVKGTDRSGAIVEKTFSPPVDLAPGAGWNQRLLNEMADRFVGAGTCEGPDNTSSLVGMVNELNSSGALDEFLVYEGVSFDRTE